MITAVRLAELMAGIEPIGLDDGATTRLAWTPEEAAARRWFEGAAREAGLTVEHDPAGNLWAIPGGSGPWWGVGSHLDSVPAGGRFDGALGVAAGFAIAEQARVPLAVVSFVDEEGGRFNSPTFGSRALAGALDLGDVLGRRDRDGVELVEAIAAAGVDPAGIAAAPAWLTKLSGFVELHIDQTTELEVAGAAAGAVARLAARLRLEVELRGSADHAGTTSGSQRHDALLAAAQIIVRGSEIATGTPSFVFSAGRIEVEPNAPTTVAERVRVWLDVRAPRPEAVRGWHEQFEAEAERLGAEASVAVAIRTASWSEGTEFDRRVRERLESSLPPDSPSLTCYAGHDAGVLAPALPAGMVLVRNAEGISHAPEEEVELEDAAVAANAICEAIEALAGEGER